jgi:RNA-binding protein Nova
VLLLSGSLHSVLTAIFLILEKVARDTAANKARTGSKGGAKEDREDEVGKAYEVCRIQVSSRFWWSCCMF